MKKHNLKAKKLFKKPEPKKCLNCGEPVTTNGRYCSSECKEEHELDLDSLDEEMEDLWGAPEL